MGLRQNLIVSVRRLRSSPGFALSAIITLALGIGANTAIFTAVNGLIFRSLPVDQPEQLAFLNVHSNKTEYPVQSYPNYLDYRDRNNVLSGLIACRITPSSLSRGDGNNARVWLYEVTGNYFDVLGVKPLRGRVLHPDDDRTRGGHPIAVITYACWQRRFAGDPDIAGKKVKLNGMDYTIAGVTPRGFSGTELVLTPEIFVPIAMAQQLENGARWVDDRDSQNLFVLGRLKPGVTMPQAQTSLNVIAAALAREYPKVNEGTTIVLSPPGLVGNFLRGTITTFAAVLMGVAGLVLLIACVNLASLLLARASDRRKETAVRLALGASRGDLIRQLLTESVVLSLIGGAAGLLLAIWLVDLFGNWRPPIDVPVMPTLSVDPRVMFFALGVSILTGLLFGLAPAIQSTRADLAPALKGEAVSDRLRRFQLRDVLVAAQIALSVVLLIGSVLVVRSLQRALTLPLGFEPRQAATVAFDLGLQGYDTARGREFHRRLLERVRSLPGIESAGIIDNLPLSMNYNMTEFFIEGHPVPKASDVDSGPVYSFSPGYLHSAQTKLVAGRDFTESDQTAEKAVSIVNEAFVRQLLPGENPIGKRWRTGADNGTWHEIVGVIQDGKYHSLGEASMPAVFMATHGPDFVSGAHIVARSTLPEEQVVSMLRRAVLEIDPTLAIYSVGSLTDQLGLVLFPARIAAGVLGSFGLLAVVLAATGVYGIVAYAVSRRTREIGIRVALGAKPAQVVRVVLKRTVLLLVIGTATGLALALVAGSLFAQILYGVSATDPATYIIAIALMAAVALAACWFPALRAMKVDPITALRTE